MSATKHHMENKGFQKNVETGTELQKVASAGSSIPTTTCTPEVCRQARQRFQPPDLSEGPWQPKKTYFFIGIIVLMIIWIIGYSIATHYNLV